MFISPRDRGGFLGDMIAFKLVSKKKDGGYGSLFINRRHRLQVGEWDMAEDHQTKGYAHRPGWHCTHRPVAPHLKDEGRVWLKVEVKDYEIVPRPKNQGGGVGHSSAD